MNEQKTFTIVIATYNAGEKVERTLRSILANDPGLFELIVVDGASTDCTLSTIKKYGDHLTLLSEPDEGVYDAFNKAIDMASGQYLYFIGAGDLLRPGVLAEVQSILPKDDVNLVYGKCFFTKRQMVDGKEFAPETFVRNNLCQQGIFYGKNIFELQGKFDRKYPILADWIFNLQCFLDPSIKTIYIDKIIADYEEGGISQDFWQDREFVRDFPPLIKRRFGQLQYLLCKAFLLEPQVVNSTIDREFRWLFRYIRMTYRPQDSPARAIRRLRRALGKLIGQ